MITVLKTFAVVNKIILYMNNYYRHCYFDIIDFIVNYEKQILITKIKTNQYYIIYILSSYERKNLLQCWSTRNYKSTKVRIARQFIYKIKLKHFNWVHSVKNSIWNYFSLNDYNIMLINIFFLLHSNGVIIHFFKINTQALKQTCTQAEKI